MKKLLIIFTILLVPAIVHAETITYNICKSGCDYNSIAIVVEEINSLTDDADIIINFGDSETYVVEGIYITNDNHYIKSIVINGNNATLTKENESESGINMFLIPSVRINNLNINLSYILIAGDYNPTEFNDETVNQYNNYKTVINNSSFKSDILGFAGTKTTLNSCQFDIGLFGAGMAEIAINDSLVNFTLFAGAIPAQGFMNTKVKLNNCTFSENSVKKTCNFSDSDCIDAALSGLSETDRINKTLLIQFDISEEIERDFSDFSTDVNNYIYITQEVKKPLKKTTSIKQLEKKLVSDGIIVTDEVDELNIQWKSENEKIAKIEDDEIIPVSSGIVNIIGTTETDQYTISLEVEKESISEKIDDMTIEIPPAGIKIKVWVLVVAVLLFGIIGIFIYLLIRNKKVSK